MPVPTIINWGAIAAAVFFFLVVGRLLNNSPVLYRRTGGTAPAARKRKLKPVPDTMSAQKFPAEGPAAKGGLIIPDSAREKEENTGEFETLVVSPHEVALPPPEVSAPAPPLTEFNTIDRILGELPVGQIAFSVPTPMTRGKTYDVDLVLSAVHTVEELELELQKRISGQVALEGAKLKIGPEMQASLTGQNFQITAGTPDTQIVTQKGKTSWQWQVQPLIGGPLILHLALSVVLTVKGHPVPKVIKTFDRYMVVQVTWTQRVNSFARDNPGWVFSAVLIPLLIWGFRNLFASLWQHHGAMLEWLRRHLR